MHEKCAFHISGNVFILRILEIVMNLTNNDT